MHLPKTELAELEISLSEAKSILEASKVESTKTLELVSLEEALRDVDNSKNELLREVGRIEGEVHSIERLIRREKEALMREDTKTVYLRDVEVVAKNVEEIKNLVQRIKDELRAFVEQNKGVVSTDSISSYENDLNELQAKRNELEEKIVSIKTDEVSFREKIANVKSEMDKDKEGSMEAEKNIFKIIARQNELFAVVGSLRSRENQLHLEEEDFKRELQEAYTLAGREAVNYEDYELKNSDGSIIEGFNFVTEDRPVQHDRRRNIEKIKIRLEEMGGGGSEEIMKEFRDAEERDSFLAKEVSDLEQSSISLAVLIKELEEKLNLEFKQGIDKINTAFTEFFQKMFGGGHAGLRVVRELKRRRGEISEIDETIDPADEEYEEGIEIDVSHPFKKVKSLMMLSGGERALTSIALLFAISQVNPPPFIILDETDAALDEANSRKYGDMIESLAKYSQLILITHNRETMSRAGVLYGVTMGAGGASKLLSIKFDEAVAVAK